MIQGGHRQRSSLSASQGMCLGERDRARDNRALAGATRCGRVCCAGSGDAISQHWRARQGNEALGDPAATIVNHLCWYSSTAYARARHHRDVALQNFAPSSRSSVSKWFRGPRSKPVRFRSDRCVIQIFHPPRGTTSRAPSPGHRRLPAAATTTRAARGVSGGCGNALCYKPGVTSMVHAQVLTRGLDAPSPEPDNDGYREESANINCRHIASTMALGTGRGMSSKCARHNDYARLQGHADNLLRTHGLRARFAPNRSVGW